MSQIGHSSSDLDAYPALKSHCVAAGSVNVDRTSVPANEAGYVAGTDLVTSTVKAAAAGSASSQEAKRIADRLEYLAERSESQQYWSPA